MFLFVFFPVVQAIKVYAAEAPPMFDGVWSFRWGDGSTLPFRFMVPKIHPCLESTNYRVGNLQPYPCRSCSFWFCEQWYWTLRMDVVESWNFETQKKGWLRIQSKKSQSGRTLIGRNLLENPPQKKGELHIRIIPQNANSKNWNNFGNAFLDKKTPTVISGWCCCLNCHLSTLHVKSWRLWSLKTNCLMHQEVKKFVQYHCLSEDSAES